MRRSVLASAVLGATALAGLAQIPAVAAPAAPAASSGGTVTVFETEAQALTVYEDPRGCQALPALAHVLGNHTDRTVRVYGNPFCLGPAVTVAPGHGTHVPGGAGSFSA
ncbi:hypothetical protein [Streptomyces laurentii]|uniref:hypothetical protein n=1 Tax=Streptomyces laurentii TaxID=39478 RepID=UPI0036A71C26